MNQPFRVTELLELLNELAPFGLAEAWDNVGLMVGHPAQEVAAILAALDPTEEVLEAAQAGGANVVVTHHPLIFHPLRAVRLDEPEGRMIARAIEQRVAIISCHTNLDLIRRGVSDVLAAKLGLGECTPLRSGAAAPGSSELGFGRVGDLVTPLPGQDFLQLLLGTLEIPVLRVAGPVPTKVRRVAVCGGSGSDLAEAALARGAQVFVSGEIKHSTARWAESAGLCVVDAGHFATEKLVVPALGALLQEMLAIQGLQISVQAHFQQSPLKEFTGPGALRSGL